MVQTVAILEIKEYIVRLSIKINFFSIIEVSLFPGSGSCQSPIQPKFGEITNPAQNLSFGKAIRSAQFDHYGLDDNIADPSLLDPHDVAVLYQLKTVTQPPSNPDELTEEQPSFKEPRNRRITTRAGQTATLNCGIKNLGTRQVCAKIYKITNNKIFIYFFIKYLCIFPLFRSNIIPPM